MRFAVVGDPIDHSRSPAIHRAAFDHLGIDARYDAIRVPEGTFGTVVAMIGTGALDGVNVTMPLKTEAFEAVDHLGPEASASRAVNTVIPTDDGLRGDNTDVDGVTFAVERLGLDDETPVVILGGGGAARAAAVAMRARTTVIQTRRPGLGSELLAITGVDGTERAWGEPVDEAIVINATPLGMKGEDLPAGMLTVAAGLVDMVYGEHGTSAVHDARRAGLPVSDGLDMLVGQAASAFEQFTGHRAPVAAMEAAARS